MDEKYSGVIVSSLGATAAVLVNKFIPGYAGTYTSLVSGAIFLGLGYLFREHREAFIFLSVAGVTSVIEGILSLVAPAYAF